VKIFGKILLRNKIVEAGMLIEDGLIKEISKKIAGKKYRGVVMPAGIDVHVHLRDFEESHKETIRNGTLSALNGGICLVVDQPNTKPFIDSEEMYLKRIRYAEKFLSVDYSLNLGVTRQNADKINQIAEKIKEMGYNPAIGEVFLQHENIEYQIDVEIVESFEHFTTIHAECPEFVESNRIPNFRYRKREAEIKAVERLSPRKLYFCHVSTSEALNIIKKNNSYAEVTPHHLLLSEEDYGRLGDLVNVNPPLRKKHDQEYLFSQFQKADVVASDHAPHTIEEKIAGASGFPGVETLYPVLMGQVFLGRLNIFQVMERISENPARIFGFDGYGWIEVNNYANLAIFDLSRMERLKSETLHCFSNWTPFEGFPALFPHTVILRGEVVKDGGEIIEMSGKVYRKDFDA